MINITEMESHVNKVCNERKDLSVAMQGQLKQTSL